MGFEIILVQKADRLHVNVKEIIKLRHFILSLSELVPVVLNQI